MQRAEGRTAENSSEASHKLELLRDSKKFMKMVISSVFCHFRLIRLNSLVPLKLNYKPGHISDLCPFLSCSFMEVCNQQTNLQFTL